MRHPELERQIQADPDNPNLYLVYADWLQERGDPRGRLIAAQLALENERIDAQRINLALEESNLLTSHADELEGPLRWRRQRVVWRRGFLFRVDLDLDRLAHDDTGNDPDLGGALLSELLAHPSAVVLRELVLRARLLDHRLPAALDALVDGPRLPLHRLEVSVPTEVCDLAPILASLPGLRTIDLHLWRIELDALTLPQLNSLRLNLADWTPAHLRCVADAELPALTHLTLDLHHQGKPLTLQDLDPVLHSRHLSSLRHLALRDVPFGDDLVQALVDSPLLRQLESLDLAGAGLSAVGARKLASARFAHVDLKFRR